MITTELLTKRYGAFLALDRCSLHIPTGEVFGLLGPNGAGKTTLIRMLLGFLRPSSGSARVDGFDCITQSLQVRDRIAYLPAESRLFRRMRADEVLRFFASVRGKRGNLDQARRYAERLDLDLSKRVAMMSTGMRQKLALIAALSHRTPVLILDEPTANLDPSVRRQVLAIIGELRQDGRTVLLSSHVLSEIEESCQHVGILSGGRVAHLQSMAQLRSIFRATAIDRGEHIRPPSEWRDRVSIVQREGRIQFELRGELADFLPWLAQLALRDLQIEPYGLRAVYDRFHASEVSL